MSILKEFKEFAIKGNVIDMAVGIVIGAAFGGVVKSLVDDIITPPLGLLIGQVDFSTLALHLNANTTVNFGKFINTVINFTIVAFAIFMVIKQINLLKRQPPQEPTTKACPKCCSTIPIKATRCPACTSELAECGATG